MDEGIPGFNGLLHHNEMATGTHDCGSLTKVSQSISRLMRFPPSTACTYMSNIHKRSVAIIRELISAFHIAYSPNGHSLQSIDEYVIICFSTADVLPVTIHISGIGLIYETTLGSPLAQASFRETRTCSEAKAIQTSRESSTKSQWAVCLLDIPPSSTVWFAQHDSAVGPVSLQTPRIRASDVYSRRQDCAPRCS